MTRAILSTLVLAGFVGGCTYPIRRDLGSDPIKTVRVPKLAALNTRLYVAQPRDVRPQLEKSGGSAASLRYFVPAMIVFVWSGAGPIYHDPWYLEGEEPMDALRRGLEASLRKSGLVELVEDRAEADYVLDCELRHLYGVNYAKDFVLVTDGAALVESYSFYPSGQASLGLRLLDATDDKPIEEWRMAEQHMFHPDRRDLRDETSWLVGDTPVERENDRTNEAVRALGRVLLRLPHTLEQVLEGHVALAGQADSETFMIARQLSDYEFIEVAQIDRETGEVLKSRIERRTMPVFTRPGEWVLSPYQPQRLAREDYLELCQTLQERYEIAFCSNLTSAKFLGLRE